MFLKFYAILVVYPYRRKPGFVSCEFFVILRMVTAKPQRVFRVPHQVYHADILAYDLRLKAVLFVCLAGFVQYLQIFLVEDNFHIFSLLRQS